MEKLRESINKAPDPTDSLSEDFVLKTRPGLLELFPDFESEGKDDSRSKIVSFDLNQEDVNSIPKVVWEVAKYGHENWNIPIDAYCKCTIGVYMRKSKMVIPNPTKDVLCRIILNYGYDERYFLQDIEIINKIKNVSIAKEIVAKANSAILLGPHLMCDHQILIKPDPHINLIPSHIEEHIAKSKLSPLGGRTSTIRVSNYKRITIILDYRGTDPMIQKFIDSIQNSDGKSDFGNLINKLTGSDLKIPKSKKGLEDMLKNLKSNSSKSS